MKDEWMNVMIKLQDMFLEGSLVLHKATQGRLYFGQVIVYNVLFSIVLHYTLSCFHWAVLYFNVSYLLYITLKV